MADPTRPIEVAVVDGRNRGPDSEGALKAQPSSGGDVINRTRRVLGAFAKAQNPRRGLHAAH